MSQIESSQEKENLLGPIWDILLTSVLPFLFVFIAIISQAELSSKIILTLYTLFSFPHFMASYDIAFSRKHYRNDHKFILYGFPLVSLAIIFGTFYLYGSIEPIIQILIVMLIWHFVKQSYGVSIWSSVRHNVSLTKNQKTFLLLNFLLIGMLAIFYVHDSDNSMNYAGQYITLANVPELFTDNIFAIVIVILVAVYISILIYNRTKPWEVALVFFPMVSNLTWFYAIKINPVAIALLPFLHGMQYTPFILKASKKLPRTKLKVFLMTLIYIATGYVILHELPRALSIWAEGELGGLLFSAVILTVNFHHYAIDSVIWKIRKKEVREQMGL